MKIITIECKNRLRNLNYILLNEQNEAISIDPWDAQLILDALKGVKLKYIVNTHEHHDHIRGNQELKTKTGAEILSVPGIEADQTLRGGESIEFGNHKIKVVYTPGHTQKHISLMLGEHCFCGDMLFNAGIGNCKNGGDPETMYETYKSFFHRLPEESIVYPGHDYIENNLRFAKSIEPGNAKHDEFMNRRQQEGVFLTRIREEKQINPFFRLKEPKIQEQLELQDEKEIFLELRRRRDLW